MPVLLVPGCLQDELGAVVSRRRQVSEHIVLVVRNCFNIAVLGTMLVSEASIQRLRVIDSAVGKLKLREAERSDCNLSVSTCRTVLRMHVAHKNVLVVSERVFNVSHVQSDVVCVILSVT